MVRRSIRHRYRTISHRYRELAVCGSGAATSFFHRHLIFSGNLFSLDITCVCRLRLVIGSSLALARVSRQFFRNWAGSSCEEIVSKFGLILTQFGSKRNCEAELRCWTRSSALQHAHSSLLPAGALAARPVAKATSAESLLDSVIRTSARTLVAFASGSVGRVTSCKGHGTVELR